MILIEVVVKLDAYGFIRDPLFISYNSNTMR